MKYELIYKARLPKIGLGTARIGGRFIPNRTRDMYWLAAMRSALELGYTHLDTAEFYGFGYSEELIGRTLREMQKKREDVFITTKVWTMHLSYKDVLQACENSLRRLATDYIDLYLVHIPNPFIPLKDTFRALNQLVKQGKVRYIGVSNFGLDLLKEAQNLSETRIITNQVPYSLHERLYVKNGVLAYCQQNDILVTAYSPLRHNRIRTDRTLALVANAHGATPFQIALAWLISQPRVITIPMSLNPSHQKENLEAVKIELSHEELELLTRLG